MRIIIIRQIEAVTKEDLKNVYESLPSVFQSPVPGRSRESLQPVPAATAAAVVAVLEPNAPLFAVRTNLRARGGRVNMCQRL